MSLFYHLLLLAVLAGFFLYMRYQAGERKGQSLFVIGFCLANCLVASGDEIYWCVTKGCSPEFVQIMSLQQRPDLWGFATQIFALIAALEIVLFSWRRPLQPSISDAGEGR